MSELNNFTRHVDELKKDKRKSKFSLKASNHRAYELDHRVFKLEKAKEKAKNELGVMAEQLTSSVEMGYGVAMDYFKNEAKKDT